MTSEKRPLARMTREDFNTLIENHNKDNRYKEDSICFDWFDSWGFARIHLGIFRDRNSLNEQSNGETLSIIDKIKLLYDFSKKHNLYLHVGGTTVEVTHDSHYINNDSWNKKFLIEAKRDESFLESVLLDGFSERLDLIIKEKEYILSEIKKAYEKDNKINLNHINFLPYWGIKEGRISMEIESGSPKYLVKIIEKIKTENDEVKIIISEHSFYGRIISIEVEI